MLFILEKAHEYFKISAISLAAHITSYECQVGLTARPEKNSFYVVTKPTKRKKKKQFIICSGFQKQAAKKHMCMK